MSRLASGKKSPLADPRIAELEKMGVARPLLNAAGEIGYDAFMTFWRLLDAEPAYRTARGIEITMRTYNSFLRYQRNRVIETLVAEGKSVREIRQYLKEMLCEEVTPRHIRRLRGGR